MTTKDVQFAEQLTCLVIRDSASARCMRVCVCLGCYLTFMVSLPLTNSAIDDVFRRATVYNFRACGVCCSCLIRTFRPVGLFSGFLKLAVCQRAATLTCLVRRYLHRKRVVVLLRSLPDYRHPQAAAPLSRATTTSQHIAGDSPI